MSPRLFDALAGQLAALEPAAFFGLMGEDTVGLTVALAESGPRYLGTRHEAGAVAAADGYAWASGELGIAIVSRGPGLANALTAARAAVRARRPLLLVAGAAPTAGGSSPDPKDVDQQLLARAAGLVAFPATDATSAPGALRASVASARAGRPALLTVPVDVLTGPAPAVPLRPPDPEPGMSPPGPDPDPDAVAELAELLRGARRPLVLAGRGALGRGTPSRLIALAERSGALLGTTLLAKDLFRGHPHDLGVVGGFSTDAGRAALDGVDAVVAFGASLTTWTTVRRTLFAGATVVQVDTDPTQLGAHLPISRGIVADAGRTATEVLAALAGDPPRPAPALPSLDADAAGATGDADSPLDGYATVAGIDALLPDDRTVVIDGGAFMEHPGKLLRVPGPGRFRLTADFGAIGLGLGTALGAAVARPDAATVLFTGDGGLLMALGDLETAARCDVPIVIAVLNDNAYGTERHHLSTLGMDDELAVFPGTDFAALAGTLGIDGATVTTAAELAAAGAALRDRHGPFVLDCKLAEETA